MVHTNRPITKFCCSDTPEKEVRIISIFSIVSTCACIFLVFMAFANLEQHYHDESLKQSNYNPTNCNYSNVNDAQESSDTNSTSEDPITVANTVTLNCDTSTMPRSTTPSPHPAYNQTLDKKSGKMAKKPSISTLDWIMALLLWDMTVDEFWIVLPFLWNFCDLFRAMLLLHAATTKQTCLLKLWYTVTFTNVVTGLIIFYPILSHYKAGDLLATFVFIYLFLLFYNCYALWIVNLFLEELQEPADSHRNIPNWDFSPSPDLHQDQQVERY